MIFTLSNFSKLSSARRLFLACSVMALGATSPVMAQHGAADDVKVVPLSIQASIGGALHHDKVQARPLFDRAALLDFYAQRGQTPYWIGDRGITPAAQDLFETVEGAWTHGLNPKTYHLEELRALWTAEDMQSKAELELLLSDAFLRYARDMSGMRVPASPMDLDAKHWKARIDARRAIALLNSDDNAGRILASIEPQGATYKKLRKRLIRLVDSMPLDADKVQKISLDGILRPGNSHRSIPLFRARMGLPEPTRGKFSYDDNLAEAVMAFQRYSGLTPDGVIGSQTVEMLNKSHEDQIHQIIANMERFRWADLKGKDRFVVVNIPSATLWALDGGEVKLEMPVVVGKPKRATLSFVTEIEGMRFNPTWTVPPTIKRADILPQLKQDVSYLSDKGIELWRGYGSAAQSVDPHAVDWDGISWQDLNSIRMVQTPGNHNALGRYRVLMPNKHNIYLHDTNHRDYFVRTNRALSSGCVRLGDPAKMAEFIMSSSEGWDQGRIRDVVRTGRKTDVEIDATIPVYLLYYTAWTGENGQIVLGDDIYKHDRTLIRLLKNIDGFHIPRQTI